MKEAKVFGIQVRQHGGPEVMEWVALEDPTPGPTDLVVELVAAGLNFVDTYQRGGLYPMALPFTPGSEGAGVVRVVGAEVTGFAVGDAVAWASAPGSYAQQVRVPAAAAIAVPEGIPLDVAAAVMLQGLTAHYLALDTYPLKAGERCLIHAVRAQPRRLAVPDPPHARRLHRHARRARAPRRRPVAWIVDGSLGVRIGARFPLAEAAAAHRSLEGRETTGKTLLEA